MDTGEKQERGAGAGKSRGDLISNRNSNSWESPWECNKTFPAWNPELRGQEASPGCSSQGTEESRSCCAGVTIPGRKFCPILCCAHSSSPLLLLQLLCNCLALVFAQIPVFPEFFLVYLELFPVDPCRCGVPAAGHALDPPGRW